MWKMLIEITGKQRQKLPFVDKSISGASVAVAFDEKYKLIFFHNATFFLLLPIGRRKPQMIFILITIKNYLDERRRMW